MIAAAHDVLDFPAAHVIRQQDVVPGEAQFVTEIKQKVSESVVVMQTPTIYEPPRTSSGNSDAPNVQAGSSLQKVRTGMFPLGRAREELPMKQKEEERESERVRE